MSITALPGNGSSVFLSLREIDRQIAASRTQLATGLRLESLSDNPAVRRLAAEQASQAAALAVLRADLDRAQALTAIGASALGGTSALLQSVRSLLAAAKAPGADLSAVQLVLGARLEALRSTAQSAQLFGRNLLTGADGRLAFTASSTLDIHRYAIEFDKSQTVLFGDGITRGILEAPLDLSALFAPPVNATDGLAGPAIGTPGVDAIAVPVTGLFGANTDVVLGIAAKAAQAATFRLGQIDPAAFGSGDRLQLQVTVDGIARGVTLQLPSVADQATLPTALQAALDTQFGANRVVVSAASDGAITLQTVSVGSDASLSVGSVAVLDGNGTVTGTGGLASQAAYSTAQATIGGQLRTYDGLGSFSALNVDRTDRLRLRIDALVGGQTGTVTIDVALATVTDAASLAAAINTVIAADPFYSAYAGAAVVAGEVAVYLKTNGSIRVSSLSGLDGNGVALADPKLQTGSASGIAAVSARAAAISTGSDFAGPVTLAPGMSLEFDLARNGAVTTVSVTQADVDAALASDPGYTMASGTIGDVDAFARVISEALRRTGISDVAVAATGQRLRLTATGTPGDGDSLGLGNVASTGAPVSAATLITGTDFAAPLILQATQSLSFDLTVDGTTTRVTLDRDTIDSVLGGDPGHVAGTIGDAEAFARVVQQALTDAGILDVDVGALGNRLQFTQRTPGAGALMISGVAFRSDPVSVTLLTLDLGSPAFAAADRSHLLAQLDSIMASLDAMAGDVSAAQDYVAFVGSQLAIHADFTTTIETIYRATRGALVSVDMDDETARLKALELRRGLLQQSIAMVNQSRQNVLLLFEGLPTSAITDILMNHGDP
ncbi:hypothetical protein [Aureimonas glaciei]|uniref:Flagellin N-terminal domain-containing protein n=1 Tax=Aureimonas glaciei TaxID=1776957 RepID=A0A917DCT9_9HYPH|nr:hypothetical protein [Aureimonas glaciei]GGD29593.1 hypothetical protein GCM10011335_35880 [Aureimonas glaciei]